MGRHFDFSQLSATAPGVKLEWREITTRVKFVEGRRTAQKRVTGGRWRRVALGDLLAVQVVRLRGRPRLWPRRTVEVAGVWAASADTAGLQYAIGEGCIPGTTCAEAA